MKKKIPLVLHFIYRWMTMTQHFYVHFTYTKAKWVCYLEYKDKHKNNGPNHIGLCGLALF